ncbi:pantoate--beta-alanine ligase [Paenibacillus turpanensis]|uniref:pantoate--beta-alanine ligase n=1 Tax=Paenibacillus turpanensis TaxID=2689078 RepID=UPI001407AC3E|nr:pantoate--beta-alanine ligase [Paenibacillus turpanensis]
MKIIREIAELRKYRAEQQSGGRTVGFVPTMGYLHDGHLSLVNRAKQETGCVIMSIFVNPLQFGPNEDFERYPRNEERDLDLARSAGVDAVFLPTVEEMYPSPIRTKVIVSDVTERLCGASRPGHFDGVATVVMKLFQMVQPDKAFFGMKDAQQVAVISQMVNDLNLPVEVVPCPTLREQDGLAMSSRNVYLNEEERAQAVVLSRTLDQLELWAREPGMTAELLEGKMRSSIEAMPLARIDYAEVLSFPALQQIQGPIAAVSASQESLPAAQWIAALAVRFGSTRLIDNRIFQGGVRLV